MVVDDSMIFRKVVRDSLTAMPGVEVVGVASDGKGALDRLDALKPDLITLDIEMPQLNGLQVLQELQRQRLKCGAIMLSSLTSSGARLTTQALSLGAFDFVLKPSGDNAQDCLLQLKRELLPKIDAFRKSRCNQGATSVPTASVLVNNPPALSSPKPTGLPRAAAPKVVVIGISTGGPVSLGKVLPKLPADFPVPIVIVQHMPQVFTKNLADDLNRSCALNVDEARDGEFLAPGTVRIAPGGRQLRFVNTTGRIALQVTDDPPEKMCRPSVDYLFRSAAEHFRGSVLAVIMTGMGDDGLEGCRALKPLGACVIAQDAASCVVFGMPRHIIQQGLADQITSLDEIPNALVARVKGTVTTCR